MISGTLNRDWLLIYIHWKLTWHPKIKILKFVVASFSEKPGFSFHLSFLKACSFWYWTWNSPKETWNIEIGKSKFIFTKLVNGLSHLLISGVYWGYNPLILPNFPGHPSGLLVHICCENLRIFLSNPQGFGMQIFPVSCSGERLRFTSPLVTPPKTSECRLWKSMVGRCISYSNIAFEGDIL